MPEPVNYYLSLLNNPRNGGDIYRTSSNQGWNNEIFQNNSSNTGWNAPLTSAYTAQQIMTPSGNPLTSNYYAPNGTQANNFGNLINSTTNTLVNTNIPGTNNNIYGNSSLTDSANNLGNNSTLYNTNATNLYNGANSSGFGTAYDIYNSSNQGGLNLYAGGTPGLGGAGSGIPGTNVGSGNTGMGGTGLNGAQNSGGTLSSIYGNAYNIYNSGIYGQPGTGMGTTTPGNGTGIGTGTGMNGTTNTGGVLSSVYGNAYDIYNASMGLPAGTGMPGTGLGTGFGTGLGTGLNGTANTGGVLSSVYGNAYDIYNASMGLPSGTGMPVTGLGGVNGTPAPTTPLSPAATNVFTRAASGEGRPDILSGVELSALIYAYAPGGSFNLDSFQRFSQDLGIDRATATRAFVGSAANGSLPAQTVFNAATTLSDRQSNTWNPAQFGQVVGMIAASGAAPANPTQNAFNYLSGGQQTLTPQSLQRQLATFTRGDNFSLDEFQDFGSLLNLSPANSEQIYNAFQRATFGQPSINALAAFASQRADPRTGGWTTAQFTQVAQDLALLGASTPMPSGMAMTPNATIQGYTPNVQLTGSSPLAGPNQMPGRNMTMPGVPGMPGMPTTMPMGDDYSRYSPYGFGSFSLH
jgi:hypothetical protein